MTIDNIIIALYLISMLAIGLYQRSKLTSFRNYASVRGGTGRSKLLLVATIFATSVGGATTFGISEKAFTGNISYTYGLILSVPIDILIAVYLVPRIIQHYGAESVGDIMYKYYGNSGRFIAGVSSVIVSIGFVAAQISVSGYIFQYIMNINYTYGVILSYVIVIVYTSIGGLTSIMFTNLVQFFAMIIAIPIITIFGLKQIGLMEFIDQLPPEKIYFNYANSNTPLLSNVITACLNFCVMNLYPTFIQRALINNNPNETTKAIYIKSAVYVAFLICVTLNGLIAYHLYPSQPSNLALPYLINQIIPTGLQAIVIVGLLAAVMSTADSDLNVTSIALVKDIFNPIFKVKDQQRLLMIARITNIIVGSLAIYIALKFENVIDLVIFTTGFWGPIILAPLVLALFDITASRKIMVAASICGALSFLSLELFDIHYLQLKGVFIGTMVNMIVLGVGCILGENQKLRCR